jgi:hypothetical protein
VHSTFAFGAYPLSRPSVEKTSAVVVIVVGDNGCERLVTNVETVMVPGKPTRARNGETVQKYLQVRPYGY